MSKKGENIFKRKDGRWEARFIDHYENGKARYRYLYASSYAEVKALKLKELMNPMRYFPSQTSPDSTFCRIAALWLADIRLSVRESTYTRYYRIVEKYLLPRFENQLLPKISPQCLNDLPNELLSHGGVNGGVLSPKTVSDIICVLKAILKYASENGYPVPGAPALHHPQKKPNMTQIMSEEHRMRLERCVLEQSSLTGLGILFTLYTGVRIGELCGLRWEDISFAESTVCICRTIERIANLDTYSAQRTKVVVSVPKTKSSARVIPIPDFLTQILQKYRCNPGCYLLTGNKAYTEPHQYYVRYRKFLIRNDIDCYSFHALRHTFATRCIEAGFDPKTLAEILGHANVTTTMSVYVHPTLRQKRQQMERLTPEYLALQPYHTHAFRLPKVADNYLRPDLR